MLRKRCSLTLPLNNSKKYLRILILGALPIAGLFWFLHRPATSSEVAIEKPSQLNFKKSNELAQPKIASVQSNEVEIAPATEGTQAQSLTGVDQQKWSVFKNVLETKNDNDPRIDRDLKKLSRPVHQALYEKYDKIPAELRNEKGLVTFLVARDLSSVEDIEFLKKIYEESPCLSLADCKTVGPDETHHSGVNQTTLVYPQMNTLYQIEIQLASHPELLNDPVARTKLTQLLVQAESFPVAAVHDKAAAIRARFGL